jgi:anthranilate 1,2-dioxygenase small subunit
MSTTVIQADAPAVAAMTPETHLRITLLMEEYGRLLDEDKLEAWVELFTADCRYEILSRENRDQNLPLSLMLCDSQDMLHDRIYSLREANIYNIHSDCHVLGPVRVTPSREGFDVTTAYALYQTNQGGESRLFSVGRYNAIVVERSGELKLARQIVVVDTGAILSLLATPI